MLQSNVQVNGGQPYTFRYAYDLAGDLISETYPTGPGNHSFRATGITNYLKNGGKLELAQQMAAYASPRQHPRMTEEESEISLDEIERISY